VATALVAFQLINDYEFIRKIENAIQ